MKLRSFQLLMASAAFVLGAAATLPTFAQNSPAPSKAAAPTIRQSLPDQEIGRRITVKAEDLPLPKTGPIVASRSMILPYTGQAPRVPEGFTATAFATGLEHPRRLLVLPNGDVHGGRAEGRLRHAASRRRRRRQGGLDRAPHRRIERPLRPRLARRQGLGRRSGRHLGGAASCRRACVRAQAPSDTKVADVPPEQRKPTPSIVGERMLTKKGVFGIVQGHANRHLAIDPKTGGLFVGVGSSGNIGVEPEVKASIQRFDADGCNQTTYASGMRNATSVAFNPDTGDLYATVQERDGLGDQLVPDYFTRVQQGAFYGWPYSYIGQHPQPGFAQLRPDKVKAAVTPDVLFQAHSSAMDIVFYTGSQFPAEYRGDAFVALKGSWNRSEPTGYKVVRVPFKDGKPQGSYQNFVTGFWVSGMHRAEVWGRPAALAVAKDGSLLIADDTGGTIWRIAYTGGKPTGGAPAPTVGAPPAR